MDYTPIEVEKLHEDKIGSSIILEFDPLYNPNHNKRIYGIAQKDDGQIKKGDKIYFHYNETDRGFTHPDNDKIHFIKKSRCFMIVRDGEVIPMKGWCACEPYYGENVVKEEGRVMRVSSTGLVIETDIKPDKHWAILKYAGEELKPYIGKKVYRAEATNFENKIEGESVFIMEDDLILGYDLSATNK